MMLVLISFKSAQSAVDCPFNAAMLWKINEPMIRQEMNSNYHLFEKTNSPDYAKRSCQLRFKMSCFYAELETQIKNCPRWKDGDTILNSLKIQRPEFEMITQRFGCNTYFSAERALYCNSGRETVWGKLHIAARTTTASHPAKKTGSTNTAAAITSPMKPFSDRESEFGGKYDASKDSYRHSATITRTPNGSYKVNVSVSMRGCLGAFDGIGKIEGATLVV